MLKKRIAFLLLFILLAFASSSAAFAADSVIKTYRIALRGHIVQCGASSLAIHLANPQNMAANTDDGIYPIQRLPLTADTAIADAAGKPLKITDVLPGQEVKATFRYTVSPGELPDYQITECLMLDLMGETIRRKSGATIGGLAANTMLGTVISVKDNRVEVFIDGGRILSENGTEFLAVGQMWDDLRSSTDILDAQGNTVRQDSLAPFQRVLIKAKNHNYDDGSYGYGGSEFAQIQILGNGEKILAPGAAESFHTMMATVLRHQKSAEDVAQLVVKPDAGSREAALQPEFILAMVSGDFPSTPPDLRPYPPGTRITFSYTGLNTTESPGKIYDYYQVKII